MAAQGDNPNIIIYFKEKYKMSIYSKDLKGNTPLHWACFNCAEHSVNFLLSFMNDINQQNDSGQTPSPRCCPRRSRSAASPNGTAR